MLPAQEYAERLKDRELRAARFDAVHARIGNVRLALASTTLVAAWWSIFRHVFSPWYLLIGVVGFIALGAWQTRVFRNFTDAQRGALFYKRGLLRLADKWEDDASDGSRFEDPHHVYAGDLDLFCKGGLFGLLSLARTRMGEDKLASWLLAPSPVADIRDRHAAISELRDRIDLREDLGILGEDAAVGVHPSALLDWAESAPILHQRWVPILALVLAALAIAAAAVWAVNDMPSPFLAVVLIEGLLAWWLRRRLDQVIHGAEHAFEDLDLLSHLLERMERESFTSTRLSALAQQIISHDVPASQAIARLRTIANFIDSTDNLFVKLVNVPLMYRVQCGFAAERWRRDHGRAVRRWIDAVAEIEAVVSLASYSYEHPADPFPQFVDPPAAFVASELGHPLIPDASCVRNSVALTPDVRVLLVSGSNMSGKSTLLRSVGINTVLAMAGAPVRAKCLRLSPLQVGASIRINDSLHEGSSRFYSEVTRLRAIFDLAGRQPPLLFLLDELLQGTNSKDRRIGAEGIIRALVERGAIGLASTHDLALTEIGGTLDGRMHNVHLQDEFIDGKLHFDYKLRPGVVTKSNGLEVMRSVGLDV